MRNPMVKKVLLIELTVPWDSQSSFKAAFERKTSRYAQLALDLEDKEWRVSNLSLEIGTRRSVDKRNATNLLSIQFERDLQKFRFFLPKFKLYLGHISKCLCVFQQIVFVYLYMKNNYNFFQKV